MRGNRKYAQLQELMKSKDTSRNLKIRFYKTVDSSTDRKEKDKRRVKETIMTMKRNSGYHVPKNRMDGPYRVVEGEQNDNDEVKERANRKEMKRKTKEEVVPVGAGKFLETKHQIHPHQKMKSTRDEQKAVVEEICYKPQETKPWLIIFNLPAEPVWYVSLFIINYLVILEALFNSVNNRCLHHTLKQLTLLPDVLYLVDICLRLPIQLVKKIERIAPGVVKLPLWVILFDIYSLIPQELLYSGDETHYCLMRVNRAFRVCRHIYIVYKSYDSLDRHIWMYVVDFSLAFTVCGFARFCIYCNYVCVGEKCVETACDAPDFFKGILCAMQNTDERPVENVVAFKFVRSFFTLSVITLGFFFRALFCVHQIHRATHQRIYMYRYTIMKHRHLQYNIAKHIQNRAEKGFKLFWSQTRGYRDSKRCLNIFSPVMASEILIDISWPAFKHSRLFRGMDLAFLREVSMYMEQISLMPGEMIFRKGQHKAKMIYIVSGTISVLSDEDGESPIMSFTSGTVIGETSLFISTISTNFLQCKTYCHMHILEQKNFINISLKFPDEYHHMQSVIYNRLVYARESQSLVIKIKETLKGSHRDTDIYTICWLKNILHTLMSTNAESAYRHGFPNIHLIGEVEQNNSKRLLFCANNLDMLAIAERIEKSQDANFARLKFPYIIHSTSVILKLWEIWIVFLSLVFSFLIPYMVFVSTTTPGWYIPLIYWGTFTFMVDIYFQISTTIKTPGGVLSTVTTITIRRFQTIGFWLDLFSCLPLEVFNPIIIQDLTSRNIAKTHLNRIFKIWRIKQLFESWMNSSNANHLIIIFLKYTWIFSYVTFTIFMYTRYENPTLDLVQVMFISMQWARNLHYTTEGYNMNFTIKPIIDEYVFLIILAFYASVAFIHIIEHFNLLKVQQVSFDLLSKIKKENLKSYSQRVIDFLRTQWESNFCYYLNKQYLKQIYFSKVTFMETVDAMYGEEIRGLTLFQCLNETFSYDACIIMRAIVFSPREVVTYYGCITAYIYILVKGTCEVLNAKGEHIKYISNIHCCNVPEVLLQTPNAHSFRAVTHCRVIRFDIKKLLWTLFERQVDYAFLKTFIRSCPDIKESLLELTKAKAETLTGEYKKKPNFFDFSFNMEKDSFEEYNFYIPYDRLYPFGFVRYFFLHCSILPDSKFLHTWQMIRSCLALITGICYFVPIFVIDYPWILHTLDVLGLFDIYIRLHVCFYDNKGILITHPLETARHYWRTGFLIDFLSIIPFRYIFSFEYDWTLFMINANHLLQLHSYLQMMNSIKNDIITPRSKWYSLFYIPFTMVLCNVLGVILFTVECTISPDSSLDRGIYIGYTCIPNSTLEASTFSKPITLERAHLYYIYISAVLLTNVAFQGPIIHSKIAKYTFMAGLLVGLYIGVKIVSQMQEFHCFRQGALLENQTSMRHLKKFLNTTVRDSKLKKVVIRTFELKWLRQRGQGVFQVVKPFTLTLRSDILYEFYGKTLTATSPLNTDVPLFYKNILPKLTFDLVIKGGYLQTINDIDDNIYILYQGMADVLAPDGTTLQTLQTGSIYGNITDRSQSRLKLSIIATTHVELLSCKATTFIKILQYYPRAFEQFEILRQKYLYYIPTKPGIIRLSEENTLHNSKSCFAKVLEPNCHFVRVWNLLYLTFACYLGVLLDIYQIGSGDYSYALVTMQYLCDLMFLAHFLLQDRIAYENEWGYMVYDLSKIRKRNRKNKAMLVIVIIAMIPGDVIVYSLNTAISNTHSFNGLYRINHCLRIFCLINYIRVQSKTLDVKIFSMKLIALTVWASLIVTSFASLIAWVSSSAYPNLTPETPSWEAKANWSSAAILRLHATFLYISWSAFSVSDQMVYTPQGNILIILFIFTMICGFYWCMIASCEVLSMVHEYYIKKGQYLKLFQHINFFLINQNVSASLRMKCLSICSALWTNNEGEMFPRLLEEVSPYLRDAIMNCAFKFFIAGHPVFEKCHPDFVRQLIQKIRYRIYYAGEYIQFKGAIDRTMYFVFDGIVHKLVDEYMNNDKIVEILYKGDSFGIEQGLYMRKPHKYSYRCKTTSTILSLYLHEWDYLLKYFPASELILYEENRFASESQEQQ